MSLAITAVIISALIFGAAMLTLKDESTKYKEHIHENLDEFIQSEMDGS